MNDIDVKELRVKLGISQEDLAEKIGVSPRTIQNYEAGCAIPKSKYAILRSLIDKTKTLKEEATKAEITISQPNKGLPYFDVDVTLGVVDLFNDQTVVPSYYLNVPAFKDCDCAVPVYGRSMIPDINDGSVVAIKEISIDDVLPGEAYLIITDNYRTVKYLRSCKDDNNKIRLVPRNLDEYDETTIDKAKIRRVFLVKGVITNKIV